MDSFNKPPQFVYNPDADPQPGDKVSGILAIHVHHARNIHNICIYDNQDVYAKFSLTYNPDETVSTRIIHGGGKNPDFNEDLVIKIGQMDAVLKCEIWMMSRAKNFMDDQLLGFVLIPVSSVSGKGRVTQDFALSSTDLFHSPIGTIKLSLSLNAKTPPAQVVYPDPREILMDKCTPEDYSRLEFPDMNVVAENQQMVSEFFAKNSDLFRPWLGKPDGSFLHLEAPSDDPVDYNEMAGNSMDEFQVGSASPDGSIQNSGFLSSTMTSLSDDPNSADSMEQKKGPPSSSGSMSPVIVDTHILGKKSEILHEHDSKFPGKAEGSAAGELNKKSVVLVRNAMVDAEEFAMQQQIVDMYMRSMQQFTESLTKMKLPMDLDRVRGDDGEIRDQGREAEAEEKKLKDNSRVFYGSRAFF